MKNMVNPKDVKIEITGQIETGDLSIDDYDELLSDVKELCVKWGLDYKPN